MENSKPMVVAAAIHQYAARARCGTKPGKTASAKVQMINAARSSQEASTQTSKPKSENSLIRCVKMLSLPAQDESAAAFTAISAQTLPNSLCSTSESSRLDGNLLFRNAEMHYAGFFGTDKDIFVSLANYRTLPR